MNYIEIDTNSLTLEEKIEAERNEWKALSAIRRYVRSNAKKLSSLSGKKLERRISKLQKMGYDIEFANDGTPCGISYNFKFDVKMASSFKKNNKDAEEKTKTAHLLEKEVKILKKPRKQKKDNLEKEEEEEKITVLESKPNKKKRVSPKKSEEEKQILIPEVLEPEDKPVEILVGDSFKDETTIDAEIVDEEDVVDDLDSELLDDDSDEDSRGYDGGGFGSSEHEDYRSEMFREMENGNWD